MIIIIIVFCCIQASIACQVKCRCQDCKNTISDNVFSQKKIESVEIPTAYGGAITNKQEINI